MPGSQPSGLPHSQGPPALRTIGLLTATLGGPHSGCPHEARAGGQMGSGPWSFTQGFVGIGNICLQNKVLFFKTAVVSFVYFNAGTF